MPIYTQSYSRSYTPVLTLVGGAGNTVPVYSTNYGYYSVNGGSVDITIYLSGDGGAEGAGTGQFYLSLPLTVSSAEPGTSVSAGYFTNGSDTTLIFPLSIASSTTMAIYRLAASDGAVSTSAGTMIGTDQSSTTRSLSLRTTIFI